MNVMESHVLHHPIKFSLKSNGLEKLKKRSDKLFDKTDITNTNYADEVECQAPPRFKGGNDLILKTKKILSVFPLISSEVFLEKCPKSLKRVHEQKVAKVLTKCRKLDEDDQIIVDSVSSSTLVIKALPKSACAIPIVPKDQFIMEIFTKSREKLINKACKTDVISPSGFSGSLVSTNNIANSSKDIVTQSRPLENCSKIDKDNSCSKSVCLKNDDGATKSRRDVSNTVEIMKSCEKSTNKDCKYILNDLEQDSKAMKAIRNNIKVNFELDLKRNKKDGIGIIFKTDNASKKINFDEIKYLKTDKDLELEDKNNNKTEKYIKSRTDMFKDSNIEDKPRLKPDIDKKTYSSTTDKNAKMKEKRDTKTEKEIKSSAVAYKSTKSAKITINKSDHSSSKRKTSHTTSKDMKKQREMIQIDSNGRTLSQKYRYTSKDRKLKSPIRYFSQPDCKNQIYRSPDLHRSQTSHKDGRHNKPCIEDTQSFHCQSTESLPVNASNLGNEFNIVTECDAIDPEVALELSFQCQPCNLPIKEKRNIAKKLLKFYETKIVDENSLNVIDESLNLTEILTAHLSEASERKQKHSEDKTCPQTSSQRVISEDQIVIPNLKEVTPTHFSVNQIIDVAVNKSPPQAVKLSDNTQNKVPLNKKGFSATISPIVDKVNDTSILPQTNCSSINFPSRPYSESNTRVDSNDLNLPLTPQYQDSKILEWTAITEKNIITKSLIKTCNISFSIKTNNKQSVNVFGEVDDTKVSHVPDVKCSKGNICAETKEFMDRFAFKKDNLKPDKAYGRLNTVLDNNNTELSSLTCKTKVDDVLDIPNLCLNIGLKDDEWKKKGTKENVENSEKRKCKPDRIVRSTKDHVKLQKMISNPIDVTDVEKLIDSEILSAELLKNTTNEFQDTCKDKFKHRSRNYRNHDQNVLEHSIKSNSAKKSEKKYESINSTEKTESRDKSENACGSGYLKDTTKGSNHIITVEKCKTVSNNSNRCKLPEHVKNECKHTLDDANLEVGSKYSVNTEPLKYLSKHSIVAGTTESQSKHSNDDSNNSLENGMLDDERQNSINEISITELEKSQEHVLPNDESTHSIDSGKSKDVGKCSTQHLSKDKKPKTDFEDVVESGKLRDESKHYLKNEKSKVEPKNSAEGERSKVTSKHSQKRKSKDETQCAMENILSKDEMFVAELEHPIEYVRPKDESKHWTENKKSEDQRKNSREGGRSKCRSKHSNENSQRKDESSDAAKCSSGHVSSKDKSSGVYLHSSIGSERSTEKLENSTESALSKDESIHSIEKEKSKSMSKGLHECERSTTRSKHSNDPLKERDESKDLLQRMKSDDESKPLISPKEGRSITALDNVIESGRHLMEGQKATDTTKNIIEQSLDNKILNMISDQSIKSIHLIDNEVSMEDGSIVEAKPVFESTPLDTQKGSKLSMDNDKSMDRSRLSNSSLDGSSPRCGDNQKKSMVFKQSTKDYTSKTRRQQTVSSLTKSGRDDKKTDESKSKMYKHSGDSCRSTRLDSSRIRVRQASISSTVSRSRSRHRYKGQRHASKRRNSSGSRKVCKHKSRDLQALYSPAKKRESRRRYHRNYHVSRKCGRYREFSDLSQGSSELDTKCNEARDRRRSKRRQMYSTDNRLSSHRSKDRRKSSKEICSQNSRRKSYEKTRKISESTCGDQNLLDLLKESNGLTVECREVSRFGDHERSKEKSKSPDGSRSTKDGNETTENLLTQLSEKCSSKSISGSLYSTVDEPKGIFNSGSVKSNQSTPDKGCFDNNLNVDSNAEIRLPIEDKAAPVPVDGQRETECLWQEKCVAEPYFNSGLSSNKLITDVPKPNEHEIFCYPSFNQTSDAKEQPVVATERYSQSFVEQHHVDPNFIPISNMISNSYWQQCFNQPQCSTFNAPEPYQNGYPLQQYYNNNLFTPQGLIADPRMCLYTEILQSYAATPLTFQPSYLYDTYNEVSHGQSAIIQQHYEPFAVQHQLEGVTSGINEADAYGTNNSPIRNLISQVWKKSAVSQSVKSSNSINSLNLDDDVSDKDDLSSCAGFEFDDLEPLDPFQKFVDAPRPKYEHIIKTEVHPSTIGKRFEYAYLKSTSCNCVPPNPDEILLGKAACDENCFNRQIKVECNRSCPVYDLCTNRRFQEQINAPIEPFYCGKEKGWGIRSLSKITAGTFVIEYVGELINFNEFLSRINKLDSCNRNFFMTVQKDMFIDAGTKGNWARFVNHSCDPNTIIEKWVVGGKTRIGLFTTKDINKDEEITIDYQFQQYGTSEQKCYCSSANCTGIMGEVNKKLREQIMMSEIRQRNELLQRIISRKSLKEISHVSEMITIIKEKSLDRNDFFSFLEVLLRSNSTSCIHTFIECGGLNVITSNLDNVPWNDWSLKLLYLQCLDHFKLKKRALTKSGNTSATVVEYWSTNPRYVTTHYVEDSLEVDSLTITDSVDTESHIRFSLPNTDESIVEDEKHVQSLARKIKEHFNEEKEKFFIPKLKSSQIEFSNEFSANDSESKSISIASSVQGDYVQMKKKRFRRKCGEAIKRKLSKDEFRRLFTERHTESLAIKNEYPMTIENQNNDKIIPSIKQLLSNVIIEEINCFKQNELFSTMPIEFQNLDIDKILSDLNIVEKDGVLSIWDPRPRDPRKPASLSNYSKSPDDTSRSEQESSLSSIDQLPPNWRFCHTENKRIYFYHSISKKTQWEIPVYPWDAGEDDSCYYDYANAQEYEVTADDIKRMELKVKENFKEEKLQERQKRRLERSKQKKMSLSEGDRNKIKFSHEVFKAVKFLVKPYFSSSCTIGKIKSKADLKYLCEKFAETVIVKEVKKVTSLEDLDLNSDVLSRLKSYIGKYMTNQGRYYKRSKKHKDKHVVTTKCDSVSSDSPHFSI